MQLTLAIQNHSEATDLPGPKDLRHWIEAALAGHKDLVEMCVRIVDKDEMAELNKQYRQKDGPTNVLAFPAELPEGLELPLLGDLVICAPVIVDEAAENSKAIKAHWAHIVVHGTLHLIGYDHIKDDEAREMESLEIEILTKLGFANPYEV